MSIGLVYKQKSPLDPKGITYECPKCGTQLLVWQNANGHIQFTLAKLPKEGRQALIQKFMELFEQEPALTEGS